MCFYSLTLLVSLFHQILSTINESFLRMSSSLFLVLYPLFHHTKLLIALVDVISSQGWFKPALIAMQLSQMLVQAMWVDDSPLLQLPHFDANLVDKCRQAGVRDIGDLLNMEDDERVNLLNMNDKELADLANVCNKYPNVTMEHRVLDDEIVSGESAEVEVNLTREDEDYTDLVYAPYFPKVLSLFGKVV